MCDDVHATVEEPKDKGVEFTRPITDEGFGLMTALELPGGGELALYEQGTRVRSRRAATAQPTAEQDDPQVTPTLSFTAEERVGPVL